MVTWQSSQHSRRIISNNARKCMIMVLDGSIQTLRFFLNLWVVRNLALHMEAKCLGAVELIMVSSFGDDDDGGL